MPNISSSQTRRAAVAGTFYPDKPQELAKLVTDLLSEAGEVEGSAGAPPKALIAPHAGYIYSGPVAASAFATLQPHAASVRRVVLLGPAHFVPVRGLALPGCDAFATPLGEVALDSELAARVAELEQVEVSPSAHAPEHSLEVELPFLQTVLGEFRLLPLLVGDGAPEEVEEVLERVWGGSETLIVVSSDLSHYLPYDQARVVDGATARQILELRGPLRPHQACGAGPINGLLPAVASRSLKARLVDLRNSGETAGGREQVVGYGAFAFA